MARNGGKIHNIHYGDILTKYSEIVSLENDELDYLTADGEAHAAKDYVLNGDIIIADTAEDEMVGKVVEVQDVGDSKVLAGLHTMFYRPPANLFVRGWLGYWMNSAAYHDQLIQYMTGTKVLSLSKASLAETVIQYPSKEEQCQIVSALESVQKQILSLQLLLSKYESIKKATVKKLMTPKEGWNKYKIEDLFDIQVGGDLNLEHYSPNKTTTYCYEIVSNSLTNRGVYGYTSLPHYSADSITVTGRGNVGHAEYRKETFDAIIRIVILTPKDSNVCSRFISELINSTCPFQVESTGVPQLTAPQIASTEIHIPAVCEQKQAVETLDALENVIDMLMIQLAKVHKVKSSMLQYFFGD